MVGTHTDRREQQAFLPHQVGAVQAEAAERGQGLSVGVAIRFLVAGMLLFLSSGRCELASQQGASASEVLSQ